MTRSTFTPTIEHLELFGILSVPVKFSLRLLAKSMKFRDLIDYFIGEDSHPNEDRCIMLAEIACYMLNDDLSLKIEPSIPLIYSDN